MSLGSSSSAPLFRLGPIDIGRSQLLAGLFLLAFLSQALLLAYRRPFDPQERAFLGGGACMLHLRTDCTPAELASREISPATSFFAALPFTLHKDWLSNESRWWIGRLPFVFFGLWLAGGLWWVAHRLFDDIGGFIALLVFSFSPHVVGAASQIDWSMLAMWGFYGAVYTAIGVAHTIYAPARYWRVRPLILGFGIGIALAANSSLLLPMLLVTSIFMLYLAPGRRLLSLALLLASFAIGVGITYIFARVLPSAPEDAEVTLRLPVKVFFPWAVENLATTAMLILVVIIALSWRRARYFGNLAPLFVAILFAAAPVTFINSPALAAPFACTAIAGVFSDLVESRSSRFWWPPLSGLLLAHVALALYGLSAALKRAF